jgi:flagellar biosynthesis GTPase FlhF
VSLPFKENPVFRGYRIRLYGKGGQRPLRYATHAFIYYPGSETVRVDFPSSKRKIADREKYLANVIIRLDRARKQALIALEEKKAKEKAKRKRDALKRKREREEIEAEQERKKEIARKKRAEDRARKKREQKELEEEKRRGGGGAPPIFLKLPLFKVESRETEHHTNHPESSSKITAGYAGSRIASTVDDLIFDAPIEIRKKNKDEYLALLKEEYKKFARHHMENVTGRGEFLLRIYTKENHITEGKRENGFGASPGRMRIENLDEMNDVIEGMFESFSTMYDQYIRSLVTPVIGFAGFSIEQVTGSHKPEIDL